MLPNKYSREYTSWRHMNSRCRDLSNLKYGGRGIKVCESWQNSFEQFYKDMGPRPIGKNIDRIDNDGNYEPGNCKWSTPTEQNKNRRELKTSISGKRGVTYRKNRNTWRVKFESKVVGFFKTKNEAISIRKQLEVKNGFLSNV